MARIRILIGDERVPLSSGIQVLLDRQPDLAAGDALTAVAAAVRRVKSGEAPHLVVYIQAAPGARPTRSKRSPPPESLSPRERQVVGMVARGYTNREIAELLAVSVKTIEGYRARVLEKLGARTRAELVEYAMRVGLLPAPGTSDE